MAAGYINIVRNVKFKPTTYDSSIKPANDNERLLALQRFGIFDTPSEEIFSAYTELAARTIQTPIGLMSFVGDDKVFYKESFGVNKTGQLVSRKSSPCTLAILSKEVTVFRYALSDPCVLADEKNLEEAGYKFYAGAPLISQDGFNIGILAVVDKQPRVYTEDELNRLKELAAEVMIEIVYRLASKNNQSVPDLNKRLKIMHAKVEALRR